MRLAEQRLWDSLKRNADKSLWLQRIENSVSVGMPDVYCLARNGASCWVELKSVKVPARPGTQVLGRGGLSTEQIAWHLRATGSLARSYILIRGNENLLCLIDGAVAAIVNCMNKAELQGISVASDWDQINKALKHED